MEDGRGKPKTGEVGRQKSNPTGLMKNLLTKTGDGKRKLNNQLNKKSSKPNRKAGKKTGKDQAKERSKTSLFVWWW